MKPLGTTARNWLFIFHILFVSIWIGAALSANLLLLYNDEMPNAEALSALHFLIKKLDNLIIPSGVGLFITSLMISSMTNWGFFKFRWMIVIWIILLAQIIYGVVVLGPLTENTLTIAESEGLGALQNLAYARDSTLLFIAGTLQVFVLAVAIWIVKFKPWGRRQVSQQ
jgi:uncharacterized membrane protein